MAKAKKSTKSKRAKVKDLPTKAGQARKVRGGAEPLGPKRDKEVDELLAGR